ncbi:MAG: saccharopine dehydrogenase NADP-binding domain-containing protein [Nitriliruptorales bacterium]|nr:saccharopine dehydrogenase NADP-binding domain-containing protein [Nitriliruptorales bacterium]
MAVYGLIGASGATGRLVARELGRRGHDLVAAGRDRSRVTAAVRELDRIVEVRTVDVTDAEALAALCRDVDVLLTTVGPFERLGRPVLAAAVENGAHYVDSTGELPFVRWAYEERGEAAAANGVTVVPAGGFDYVPGDLLGHLAGTAVTTPEEVHVTYAIPSTAGLVRGSTRGTRASIAGLLGREGVALVDGRLRPELPGEERRLAWFPRPVGPQHAAGFPGAEPLTVPRHVPGVQTVRTYFAMRGWQAELFQMGSNVARWGPARRFLSQALTAGPAASREAQEDTRWACVAESRDGGDIARAWAYGTDIYATTAATMVVIAEALAAGPPVSGVVAPSEVLTAGDALDTLADRIGLKWSVARPEDHDSPGR